MNIKVLIIELTVSLKKKNSELTVEICFNKVVSRIKNTLSYHLAFSKKYINYQYTRRYVTKPNNGYGTISLERSGHMISYRSRETQPKLSYEV